MVPYVHVKQKQLALRMPDYEENKMDFASLPLRNICNYLVDKSQWMLGTDGENAKKHLMTKAFLSLDIEESCS